MKIGEYPGTEWKKYAALKYCRKCAKKAALESKRVWARRSRKDNRLIRQAKDVKLGLLEIENRNLLRKTELQAQENILLAQKVMELGGKI